MQLSTWLTGRKKDRNRSQQNQQFFKDNEKSDDVVQQPDNAFTNGKTKIFKWASIVLPFAVESINSCTQKKHLY